MRRLVVVLLCLGICLSPVAAEAANPQRRAQPRKPVKPKRARVQPLARGNDRAVTSLVDTRRPQAEAEPEEYDDGGYEDEQEYEPEPRRAPAVGLGRAPGMRNHHRADGSFRPTAPGYGAFEPLVGGKAKQYGKAAAVVTTAAAIVITALAVTVLGVAFGHNLPLIFGG